MRIRPIWITFITVLSTCMVDGRAQTLVTDGVAAAVIVAQKDAQGCVPTAVAELNGYIEKISGAELDVRSVDADSQAPLSEITGGKTAILVGQSAYTRARGLAVDDLAAEGYLIRSWPDAVAIVGKDEAGFDINFDRSTASAGTLYGVYRLLEELGCRWFYPDPALEVVPKQRNLSTPADLSIRSQPYFEYRFAYNNVEWRRKIGYGGTVDPWRTRHTFEVDRVAKRYGKTHPELVRAGFHFPHPGVMDLVVAQAREYLGSSVHPGRKYFLVIPKDAYEGCTCSICTPLRTPERGEQGEFSDLIGRAVVQTAEQVKDLPGKVVYCAYEKYRLPPMQISTLPENVAVLMAAHRTAFHDPKVRDREWAMIESWRSLSPSQFYFCRYYEGFLKVTPSFAPHLIADDIQRMKAAREAGTLAIGGEMNFGAVAPDHPYAWWFCLNEYVTAKLLWNPDLDLDALLADYYDKFFGPAAPSMKRLFDRLEQLYGDPQERHLYTLGTIDELLGYLDQAKAQAGGTDWASRVAYIGQGLESLQLMKRKLAGSGQAGAQPGPDVHLTFDEGKGEVARDAQGRLEAKLFGATWTDGVGGRGSALRFDGSGSVVQLPTVNLNATDYSYELWIKPESVTFDRSQYLLGPAAWERHGLMLKNGTLMLGHRFQGHSHFGTRARLFARTAELKPHEWVHVAATFSRQSGMAMYINGVLVAMDPSQTRASEYGLAFIGAAGRASASERVDHFHGVIDDVRIYRRELSPHEIKAHFEVGENPR